MLDTNINLAGEKIALEEERYQLFFSFDNVFMVMRNKKNNGDGWQSSDYSVIKFDKHVCTGFKDFLIDIILLFRTGRLDLQRKDMICVRINGFLSCYQYNGLVFKEINDGWKNFSKYEEFLQREYKECINNLHRQNKVLSVLDGRVFHVASIDLDTYKVFTIDTEVYDYVIEETDSCVISEYSLYSLDENCQIEIVNPDNRTFQTLKNALFYLNNNNSSKKKNTLLLYNRQELEMIIDYYELKKLVV